jgi:alpha-tubulin suppressor-like RCC1 family protein
VVPEMRRNHLRAAARTVLQGRGVGVFGALGSGTLDDKYCFDEINLSLSNNIKFQPLAVSAGVGHTAVITTDHRVAIFGRPYDLSSIFKIYGLYRFVPLFAKWATMLTMMDEQSAKEVILSPIFLDDLMKQKVSSVSCSGGLTMLLTQTGKVYCFGANNFGQCGIGETKLRYWRPIAPVTLPPVIAIDTGLQHCIALCDSGEIYCWGKGKNGQLGNGDVNPINTYPRLVPMKQKCVAIAAGLNHSVALDETGILHLWGKRMSDELVEKTEQTYKGDYILCHIQPPPPLSLSLSLPLPL